MENNNVMTPRRSLEIISEAIEQGRRDVESNAGTPMVTWGVLAFVTGCAVFTLWTLTDSSSWNLLWFAMCAVGWGVYAARRRRERAAGQPSSYVWRFVRWVWMVFGMLAVAVAFIGMLSYDVSVYGSHLPITATMILLLMLASAVTAYVMKDKTYGVFTGGNIILANFALMYPGPYEALCLALSAVTLLIVPGIMINRQAKKRD